MPVEASHVTASSDYFAFPLEGKRGAGLGSSAVTVIFFYFLPSLPLRSIKKNGGTSYIYLPPHFVSHSFVSPYFPSVRMF